MKCTNKSPIQSILSDTFAQGTVHTAGDDMRSAIEADPAVRAAVEQARYELLIGFELTPEQLRYNATR